MNLPASPVPAIPRRWMRGRVTLIALAAAIFLAACYSARADEMTRRLQEELRKRNLYFGDVDGRVSSQLAAALRRYQERKGFTPTGEADADTLYSLNIPRPGEVPPRLATAVPQPGRAAPRRPRRQPDVAGRHRPAQRRGPPDPAARRRRRRRGPRRDRARPPHRHARATARGGRGLRRPTVERVRDFLTRYLQAGQNNEPEGETAFYGDRVAYYDEGVVDHAYIARDVTRYDHRWPERRFALLDPVTVSDSPDGDPDKFVVNFRYGFNVKMRATRSAARPTTPGPFRATARAAGKSSP